ncbi:MAG: aminoacyl-tRNA hydrolase [Deltaproteobacteria bacterium]|nr:aminoacyl-tRNA hydrolase [Deltaproteobacteria bacterium]
MRLVVGLGNPGPRYAETRHNVGFRTADELARRSGRTGWRAVAGSSAVEAELGSAAVLIAKPQTFMNRSGRAVAELLGLQGLEPSEMIVIHDDLDLPFGRIRLRPGGGHGGHNGLRSIVETLGTGDFARVKIGIGRPERREDVVEYVLSRFDSEQERVLGEVVERAASAVEAVLREGIGPAMNQFNA